MEDPSKFDPSLADHVLPSSLLKALKHIFAQGISECILAGGTALAGYFASHRRSDDLELFAGNTIAFTEAVMAVRSLKTIGTSMEERSHSNQFYRAICQLEGLSFTVDVVLDAAVLDIARPNVSGDVV